MSSAQLQLHLVGGFLGSGKTTAIIQAAKSLMARGVRVGVITNDQGKYLVDTAFVRLSDLPAVEVTGGCFCCNYDDLNLRLEELLESAQPQVVFAESVGSCADIVATVVKPLLELGGERLAPASFSVFADSRLLLRRLRGEDMPFSDDVVYIFDKQIEEAGLVVVNKADLLNLERRREIESRVTEQLAGKAYALQSSLTAEGVWNWVNLIQSGKALLPKQSLQIDYGRYAAGEASLAWLDQAVLLTVPAGSGRAVIEQAIRRLAQGLAERKAGIGHLKFIIAGPAGETKLSIPTLEEPGWEQHIPDMDGSEVRLLVNARVELSVDTMRMLLIQALDQPGVEVGFGEGDSFHPKEPRPTHRIA